MDAPPLTHRTRSGDRSVDSAAGESDDHAPPDGRRLEIATSFDRLTHYLFRYPAKFHPPVVRALLDAYTEPGQVVLDPFCGSGTLLVEAAACGRSSIGIDVDPVAVLVAAAKTHRFHQHHLTRTAEHLLAQLRQHQRPADEYQVRMFNDLDADEFDRESNSLRSSIPAIPNLFHWFRRYVIVDLARIRGTIDRTPMPATHRSFFRIVFASIIRNASNADPVPVSGLEVTSYMRRREEAGRLVDPFGLFQSAIGRSLVACLEYKQTAADTTAVARLGDATRLSYHVRRAVDAIISSPPYHGAVDYYRRHQLEMYWLGATENHQQRLELMRKYIGRPAVAASHPYVADAVLATALAKEWEAQIRDVDPERANAFRHYLVAMTRFFVQLAMRTRPDSPVLLIVGHSAWNASRIPTTNLFAEISSDYFDLDEVLWYPVTNRYMSYSRHNGADISTEYVLVLRRNRRLAPPF